MSDPKNSTQLISNKGEMNTRPRPIGGDFASLEEQESELNNILEHSLSATGGFSFHPDLKVPTQIASTLFEAGKWTTFAVGEGLKGLAKEVFIAEKPKKPETPEEQEKKLKARHTLEQRMQSMAAEKRRMQITKAEDIAQMIYTEIGKADFNSQDLADLHLNTSMDKEQAKTPANIVLLRNIQIARANEAKKAKIHQTSVETTKGKGLSNRTDAQEGQSTTGNAIATAG